MGRNVKIPESYRNTKEGEDFIGELTRATYDFQPRSGKIYMMPKTQVHSPDLADAFVLTFAMDAATLARSRMQSQRPYAPRLLKGLV